MLVCVALGALFANGATGPLAALMTLILPPEIKSFGLSVFEFVSFLLGPMYSVVMGVGLQVTLLASLKPQWAGKCRWLTMYAPAHKYARSPAAL